MKDNVNTGGGGVDEMPLYIDEEVLRESDAMLRKAAEKSNYKMRKSIEKLQEERRLHDLIDDYDFEGLDDDE